jgi:hypothetical protein
MEIVLIESLKNVVKALVEDNAQKQNYEFRDLSVHLSESLKSNHSFILGKEFTFSAEGGYEKKKCINEPFSHERYELYAIKAKFENGVFKILHSGTFIT